MSSADYLLQASDVPQGSPVPAVDSGCNVIPLVDGEQYFGALYKALTSLQQHPQPKQLPNGETQRSFVFISAWELDPFLNLPDPRLKQPDTLVDLLASLAEQEVDVWVLLWFDPVLVVQLWSSVLTWLTSPIRALLKGQLQPPRPTTELAGGPQDMIVIQNLKAAILLRQYQALQNRVILDYTAHPTGAHHMKVAAVYDAQQNVLDAFCGGMDPVPNRAGVVGHSEVLATHTSSPLDPSSIPVNFPPAPPTLAPGGPGKVPAGAYDIRYTVMRLDTRQVVMVSGWATISGLPAESSIAVSGMDHYFDNATNTVPPQICQVYARLAGTADLPRQAGSTKTTGATVTIGSDPSLWNPELTLWEWHDAAVQVQGAGALRVVETLRNRWNDVISGATFTIDARNTDPGLLGGPIYWHGPVNEAPVQLLPAPSVTTVSGAQLPAGSYDVSYAVTAERAGHTFYVVSDTATTAVNGSQGLQVSGFEVASFPADASISKVDIYIKSPGAATAKLAASTSDPTQPVLASSDPSQWTGDLNQAFRPQLIGSFSGLQPTPPATAAQTVQVLRTFAQISGLVQRMGVGARPYSFAPHGEFTVYYGYRKAIAQAQHYVYVEDQAMFSSLLMDMLAQQVIKFPNLRILLVVPGLGDPADANADWVNAHYWNTSIYEGVIKKAPTPSNIKLFRSRGITVHSKLAIIDDIWAAVGSANAMNHSFAVDSEMQIAIYDDASSLPRSLRTTLWAEHLNITESDVAYTDLTDMDKALTMWFDPNSSSITQPHLYRAKEIVLPVPTPSFSLGQVIDLIGEAASPPAATPWPPL